MNGMYDPDAQKIIVGYKKNSNNNGVIIVGTVSGTSISFGSENVFDDNAREISIGYDQNTQKHLIVYADNGNSLFGTAKVGTLSGTSMSFGSATVFESAQMSNPSTVYEPTAQKLVINYTDYGNSGTGTSVVATISGTSVTFGSAATFNTGGTYRISAVYHAAAAKIVIAFQDGGNSSNPTIVEGTVSGTSISFANETSLASVTGNYVSQVYDSTNKVSVVGYYDGSNSGYGTAVVRLTSYLDQNLTATNYIGISDAAYSDGATATIQVAGAVDDAQSGLTAGQLYYVQNDGTLSTTADSPSVIAGTAISATKLIVKG